MLKVCMGMNLWGLEWYNCRCKGHTFIHSYRQAIYLEVVQIFQQAPLLLIWGLFRSLKFYCLSVYVTLWLINLFVSPTVTPGCCKISWESHSVLVWSETSDCQTLKFVPFCWYCYLSMTFSLCSSLLCFLLGKVWWWKSLQVRILFIMCIWTANSHFLSFKCHYYRNIFNEWWVSCKPGNQLTCWLV